MPMRDSRMSDQWLADAVGRNPIQVVADGSIRTCPVRLTFVDLFKQAEKKRQDDDGDGKGRFGATLHFPPIADPQINAVFGGKWYELCKQKFPNQFDQQGQAQGLHWPFHDGKTKPQYAGYTPGWQFISCSSEYKPAVTDPALNPIVDESRVYSGVWAICVLNPYSYSNRKKGAGFGLQVVMIVADDQILQGGGPDPAKVLAGVNIDANFNPAAQFTPPAGGSFIPPAAAPMMPVSGPVMPPPGHYAPPVWTPPAPAWTPPAPAYPTLDYDPITGAPL